MPPDSAAAPQPSPTSAELTAAVFEHALDAILLVDDSMRYVGVNPAACTLLRYEREELLRLTIPDLTPPEDRHRVPEAWTAFHKLGRFRKPWRMLAKNGMVLPVEMSCTANILPGLHLSLVREVIAPPAPEPRTALARTLGTILVVEDEPAVRQFVVLVLEQAGYTVVAAADGKVALTLFEAEPRRFDLVLSDVLMPRLTGPELAAEIRRVRPTARVLLMSAFTGGSPERPIHLPREVVVLDKPFTLDRLLSAVAAEIAR